MLPVWRWRVPAGRWAGELPAEPGAALDADHGKGGEGNLALVKGGTYSNPHTYAAHLLPAQLPAHIPWHLHLLPYTYSPWYRSWRLLPHLSGHLLPPTPRHLIPGAPTRCRIGMR